MKVCIVGSSGVPIPSQSGGAVERHVYDLARSLARRGSEVQVLTMKEKNAAEHEIIENVHIHRRGFIAPVGKGSASTARALWKHAVFFWFVFFHILRLETDVVHAHNGIPGLAALLASRVKGVPFVFTNHTPYTSIHHRVVTESKGLKRSFEDLQVFLEKLCAKNAACVIATSKKVIEGLISIGVSESRISLVPNGVDTQRFQYNSQSATTVKEKFKLEKNVIVLYVGRIVKYKGLDFLVAAAPQVVQEYPNVKFVIVGPVSFYSANVQTPYYKELTKKIESKELSENFLFTGAVDEDDLLGFYSACDMLVLPSISEGFGMVLTEAMSCAKPVIGSRIDGIVDVIKDGEDGYLVTPAQPKELASKISTLLERPKEREEMGEIALKHVREYFDWNKLALRIMEIYDEAIREY